MKKTLLLLSYLFMLSGTLCMEISPDTHKKQEIITENRDPYIFEIPLWESPQSWDFLEQPVASLLKFSGNPEDRHTYLWQLQLLTNFLLVSSEFEPFLRDLLSVTNDISKVPVKRIYQGFHFCDEIEETNETNSLKISTPDGMAVAAQIVSLSYKQDPADILPAYNDFFDALLRTNNKEVVTAAHHFKNFFLQDKREKIMEGFRLFDPVLVMHHYQSSTDWECAKRVTKEFLSSATGPDDACDFINNEKITSIVQEMLKKNNCSYIESYIPHVIWIYRSLNAIFNTLKMTGKHRKLTYAEEKTFRNYLAIALKNISEANKQYEQLYKKILAEQNIIIRSLPQSQRINAVKKYKLMIFNPRLDPTPWKFPDTLVAKISSPVKINNENEKLNQNQDQDFLPKMITKKQQKQPVQKKKKGRNRYHKKQSQTNEQETQPTYVPKKNALTFAMTTKNMDLQDTRIIPKYDKRVIARLQNFKTNDLYHTFNPLADLFIFHYGIQKQQPNVTRPDRKDTVYYMAGNIHFRETGLTQTVLFACSKDKNGICYHRGFEKKQSSLLQELNTHQFNFDFSETDQETPDLALEEKDMHLNVPLYPDAIYKENSFYIIINDPRNDIQITLFKPQ